jgi:small-conductance mechanosensitive channel
MEVRTMRWDLGIQGVGLLIAMSLGFGLIAQLVLRRLHARWVWLVAAVAYFIAGVFVSEVWFGRATQEELQPNIDGLSFDEVLLLATLAGLIGLLLTGYLTRRSMRRVRRGG